MRLKSIENRIIEIKKTLADTDRERKMASGIAMEVFEGRLKNANRPLLEELDQLMIERGFILDRRDNLFWKAVWNIGVPVLVSIATTFVLALLLKK